LWVYLKRHVQINNGKTMQDLHNVFEDKLQKQTQLKIISSITKRSNVYTETKPTYNNGANIVQ